MIGWLVLFVLTALAAWAALGVAARAEPSGRAELGVIASLAFFALVGAPGVVLGYMGALTPVKLALASLATSAVAIVSARRPREALVAGRKLARLPWDAVAEAARARSAILLGLVWTAGLLALALWMTYIAPPESWDGAFYHEPIVGFAIQNHGFAVVDLPAHPATQATNGYTRLGECVSLWFVIFTDKTLIELPNTLAAPGVVLATYLLCRRFTKRVAAMACAPIMIMIPALWTQLRTTYIDVEVALFTISAIHFVTRPTYRVRDAVLAVLALDLFMATKLSAVAWVPPMAVLAFGRLLWCHARKRWLASAATIVLGSVCIAATVGVTLIHNVRAFHNPLWPMAYDSALFNVHLKGVNTFDMLASHPSLRELIDVKYGAPIGGLDDIHDRDYGYAITWVVVPFAIIGAIRALFGALRSAEARNVLALVAIGALSVAVTPSIMPGRYNLHVFAILCAVACFGLAGARWNTAREGVLVAGVALSIIPLYWTRGWYFGMNMKRLAEVMRHPASERAYMNSADWDLPERVAKKREEELGPGDRVAFTQDVLTAGVLWNDTFTNELGMISYENPRQFSEKLRAYSPKWVVTTNQSAAKRVLEADPSWEYLGPNTTIDDSTIFRRKDHR